MDTPANFIAFKLHQYVACVSQIMQTRRVGVCPCARIPFWHHHVCCASAIELCRYMHCGEAVRFCGAVATLICVRARLAIVYTVLGSACISLYIYIYVLLTVHQSRRFHLGARYCSRRPRGCRRYAAALSVCPSHARARLALACIRSLGFRDLESGAPPRCV